MAEPATGAVHHAHSAQAASIASESTRTAHHAVATKLALMNRLKRIEGQVRGIARMVETDVYCDDVLNQITSVEAAINGVRRQLLEAHIRDCVVEQIQVGAVGVVDELMRTIGKMGV